MHVGPFRSRLITQTKYTDRLGKHAFVCRGRRITFSRCNLESFSVYKYTLHVEIGDTFVGSDSCKEQVSKRII